MQYLLEGIRNGLLSVHVNTDMATGPAPMDDGNNNNIGSSVQRGATIGDGDNIDSSNAGGHLQLNSLLAEIDESIADARQAIARNVDRVEGNDRGDEEEDEEQEDGCGSYIDKEENELAVWINQHVDYYITRLILNTSEGCLDEGPKLPNANSCAIMPHYNKDLDADDEEALKPVHRMYIVGKVHYPTQSNHRKYRSVLVLVVRGSPVCFGGSVDKSMRLEGRAYFRAGSQYRNSSPYFELKEYKKVSNPWMNGAEREIFNSDTPHYKWRLMSMINEACKRMMRGQASDDAMSMRVEEERRQQALTSSSALPPGDNAPGSKSLTSGSWAADDEEADRAAGTRRMVTARRSLNKYKTSRTNSECSMSDEY